MATVVSGAEVDGLFVRALRGSVPAALLTKSGDYLLSVAPAGSAGVGAFSVQPGSMVFNASVVVAPPNQIADGSAVFRVEARDAFSNPLGEDPAHGRWGKPAEDYLDPVFLRADVCGGAATVNQAAFWRDVIAREGVVQGTGRRRSLLQTVDLMKEECEDLLIGVDLLGVPDFELGLGVSLAEAGMPAETISQFCDLFRPFSMGGCFCFESIRRSLVGLFGPNWLNHLGTVGVDCEVVAVKCIAETEFCPVQMPETSITLDVAEG
eukprot:2299612-Pyramimonas_sp.AAC.1